MLAELHCLSNALSSSLAHRSQDSNMDENCAFTKTVKRIAVFQIATPCSLVGSLRRFGRTHILHLPVFNQLLVEVYKVSQPRRPKFSLPWQPRFRSNYWVKKVTAFWDTARCSGVVDRRFRGAYCLDHQAITHIMETVGISVMYVYFYAVTRLSIPEGCRFYSPPWDPEISVCCFVSLVLLFI
jgi:hypothetical protein